MKDFECILGDSEILDGQLLWYLRPLCRVSLNLPHQVSHSHNVSHDVWGIESRTTCLSKVPQRCPTSQNEQKSQDP